jgi:hypothetical protein
MEEPRCRYVIDPESSVSRAILSKMLRPVTTALPSLPMCRSIKTLRGSSEPVSDEDVRAAALQYVRKLSGYRRPARWNEAVFQAAVDDVAAATQRLLDGLVVRPPRA